MLKVLQIGCGGMGKAWCDTVTKYKNTELAGVVDINQQNLKDTAEKFNLSSNILFTDLDEAIKKAKPDIAVVVTPPDARKEICTKLMDENIPIITEKPLADTPETCKYLLEYSERKKILYVVSQNYRFSPSIQTLKKAVSGSGLGRIGSVQIDFHKRPRFVGFRLEMKYPLIIDMAIHHFDLMRYIFEADPIKVCGIGWNPYWSWFKGDAEASLIFKFKEGIHVTYISSWCSNRPEDTWNGSWIIECEKGAIIFKDDNTKIVPLEGNEEIVPVQELKYEGLMWVLDDFVNAVQGGIIPQTVISDNIKSINMVFNAIKTLENLVTIEFK